MFATTNGQPWTEQPVPAIATAVPAAVACPASTTCTAVAGAQAFATADSGASWQPVAVPAALEAPSALACATAVRCAAVGTDAARRTFALTSQDGGTTWATATTPSGASRLSAVDCPTVRACFALAVVDVAGTTRQETRLWASTDAGRSWVARSSLAAVLDGLSCPDASSCLLTGYSRTSNSVLVRTTDAGASLHTLTAPTTNDIVGAVCGSPQSCVVLAGVYDGAWTAYTSADLGTSFAPHQVPGGDYFSLDCAGSFCMAGGADGGSGAVATSTDGGASWTSATVPREAQLISGVSCGSDHSCAASTYDFDYYHGGPRIIGTRDAGATWQVFKVPARHEAPIAVACARDRCIASDYTSTGNPIVVAGPS